MNLLDHLLTGFRLSSKSFFEYKLLLTETTGADQI
jgi:hypothetical protein